MDISNNDKHYKHRTNKSNNKENCGATNIDHSDSNMSYNGSHNKKITSNTIKVTKTVELSSA